MSGIYFDYKQKYIEVNKDTRTLLCFFFYFFSASVQCMYNVRIMYNVSIARSLLLRLRKMPQSHLISWCRNFVERYSFRIVLGESPETMRKLCLSTKFPHLEIRWNYSILRSVRIHKNLKSWSMSYLKKMDPKMSNGLHFQYLNLHI